MNPRLPVLGVLLLLTAQTLSCGYNFVNASAPYGVSAITVTPFREKEPVGISQSLARALSIRLAQGGVSVRTSKSATAGQLTGTVHASGVNPAPTSAVDKSVPSYRIRVTVGARLRSPEGAVLWEKTYTLNDTFLSAPGYEPETALITEAQRRTATQRLVEEFALRITEDLVLSSTLSSQGDSNDASSK